MSTTLNDVKVANSSIDNTSIGQTTPAAASFTTPPSNDNSQKAATTQWVQNLLANGALSGNGWIKFPNGLMLQWGQVTTDLNGGQLPVAFPTNFPTSVFSVVVCTYSPTDRITYVVYGSITNSGFTIGNNGSSGFAYWVAVGN